MTTPDRDDFVDAWLAEPPDGCRLFLGDVAVRLDVSQPELARAARVSLIQVRELICRNRWPRLHDPDVVRAKLRDFLRQRGATVEELETLFHGRDATASSTRRPRSSPAPSEEPPMLPPKQSLTAVAARHFKLFRNPFDGPVESPEQFFCGRDIALRRELLLQSAMAGAFVALIGESGAGKTTLVAEIEEQFAKQRRDIVVIRPGVLGLESRESRGTVLRMTDILESIITGLRAGAAVPQGIEARTRMAERMLMESAAGGGAHVLVIEEAHGMPDETLRHLKRLHELRHGRRSLLGILLVAQPELRRRLDDGLRSGSLREVAQRCEVVDLPPLRADDDLPAYLGCRAAAHGRPVDSIVAPPAVDEIAARLTRTAGRQRLSLLYPLAVNNLVTLAMNAAADIGEPLVTPAVIRHC